MIPRVKGGERSIWRQFGEVSAHSWLAPRQGGVAKGKQFTTGRRQRRKPGTRQAPFRPSHCTVSKPLGLGRHQTSLGTDSGITPLSPNPAPGIRHTPQIQPLLKKRHHDCMRLRGTSRHSHKTFCSPSSGHMRFRGSILDLNHDTHDVPSITLIQGEA